MLKSKNNKILILAAAAAVILPAAASHATSTTLGATASFLSAITLAQANPLTFSEITYVTPVAATDKLTVTTAGAATYAGNFAAGPSAAVAAGTVTISGGANGAVVNVSCSTSGTLTNGAGSTIGVDTLKIVDLSNKATGGNACAGVGTTSFSYTLAAGDLSLLMGGVIEGSTAVPAATFPGGNYSTASTGGTNINVQVVYQ